MLNKKLKEEQLEDVEGHKEQEKYSNNPSPSLGAQEGSGLLHLLLELVEVHKVVSDLLQRDIDQHTSDLGSVLLSCQSDDELGDLLFDNLFGVFVGFNNTRNYGTDSAQVTKGKGVLLHLRPHGRHAARVHSRKGHLPHWEHWHGHGSWVKIGLSSKLRSSPEVASWWASMPHKHSSSSSSLEYGSGHLEHLRPHGRHAARVHSRKGHLFH